MGKGSGRHSGNGGDGHNGLGHEDFLLWKAFTHDVDPLEEPDWDAAEDAARAEAVDPLLGAAVRSASENCRGTWHPR